jgi:DNA-binding CsgD family transcriptional regulator
MSGEVEQQPEQELADINNNNEIRDSNSDTNQTKRRRTDRKRTAQRQRRTEWQQLRILTEIRQKMLEGVINNEIMELLGISKRTFYRYMDKIYKQDKEELEKKNENTRATTINLRKDRLLHLLQNITNIAENQKVSAKDRIKADWARRDIILDLEAIPKIDKHLA